MGRADSRAGADRSPGVASTSATLAVPGNDVGDAPIRQLTVRTPANVLPGTGHGYAADIPDWVADGLTRFFTTPSGADPTHQRERRLPRAQRTRAGETAPGAVMVELPEHRGEERQLMLGLGKSAAFVVAVFRRSQVFGPAIRQRQEGNRRRISPCNRFLAQPGPEMRRTIFGACAASPCAAELIHPLEILSASVLDEAHLYRHTYRS